MSPALAGLDGRMRAERACVIEPSWKELEMKDHTLVLTGELDRVSSPALETEIERLCTDGVGLLRLDLRELGRIDATGAAVIVHRCGWCERRGCEVTLVADSPEVLHELALAGAGSRVPLASLEQASRQERTEPAMQPLPLGAN